MTGIFGGCIALMAIAGTTWVVAWILSNLPS